MSFLRGSWATASYFVLRRLIPSLVPQKRVIPPAFYPSVDQTPLLRFIVIASLVHLLFEETMSSTL